MSFVQGYCQAKVSHSCQLPASALFCISSTEPYIYSNKFWAELSAQASWYLAPSLLSSAQLSPSLLSSKIANRCTKKWGWTLQEVHWCHQIWTSHVVQWCAILCEVAQLYLTYIIHKAIYWCWCGEQQPTIDIRIIAKLTKTNKLSIANENKLLIQIQERNEWEGVWYAWKFFIWGTCSESLQAEDDIYLLWYLHTKLQNWNASTIFLLSTFFIC